MPGMTLCPVWSLILLKCVIGWYLYISGLFVSGVYKHYSHFYDIFYFSKHLHASKELYRISWGKITVQLYIWEYEFGERNDFLQDMKLDEEEGIVRRGAGIWMFWSQYWFTRLYTHLTSTVRRPCSLTYKEGKMIIIIIIIWFSFNLLG